VPLQTIDRVGTSTTAFVRELEISIEMLLLKDCWRTTLLAAAAANS
jgi:hypothetical protein